MRNLKEKLVGVIFALTLVIGNVSIAGAQEMFQNIRGSVIDQDSNMPLFGANIIVVNSDPFLGAVTDLDGNFKIENVPVGRVTLKITYLGYRERTMPNLQVGSAKELILNNIGLMESTTKLEAIEITATEDKTKVLNEMSLISARTFSVEETKRYAGSFNDPARMVAAYAGVTGDSEGNNDIVVRGNSSKGILWKLEGVDIPNPNHFADEGSTGGPINAWNSTMLANSDFYTGAFAPEYGNAFSGVFDMKLRQGNNENREHSFSLGVLGVDFTTEGPFIKGKNASYLINYRYSSLALLDQANIVDFGGVPKYQDVSFKAHVPTKKIGVFSLFGLGGLSNIQQDAWNADEDTLFASSKYKAGLGVVGLNHTYLFGKKTYLQSSVSYAGNFSGGDYAEQDFEKDELKEVWWEDLSKTTTRGALTLNHKFNAKHKVKAGVIYTLYDFNFTESYLDSDNIRISDIDEKGQAALLQSFVSWKFRVNDNLTLVNGVHYLKFYLNNNYSIEPRMALKWQVSPLNSFHIGFGIHSRMEALTAYYARSTNEFGVETQPNTNMDFGKSNHYVLGYDRMFTENLHFKTEVYYQHLYNIPIENTASSTFSLINTNGWFSNRELVNEGKGKNYGIELTLERYFNKNLFYMITASFYESKYQAKDGIWRDTRFNGNYAGNVIVGKEFYLGPKEKNRILGVSSKLVLIGGHRYTPIDLEQSQLYGYQIRKVDEPYSAKGDDIFKWDVAIYYRKDRKKTTHEFKIDVQNATNNKAVVRQYYDSNTETVVESTQLPLLPVISYKIDF
ncbi:MAG: TonB-dependent receptor [Flavobacteriales bacterium]|nr:TonB-dependent receptor [Flavobacteriales bacterium]